MPCLIQSPLYWCLHIALILCYILYFIIYSLFYEFRHVLARGTLSCSYPYPRETRPYTRSKTVKKYDNIIAQLGFVECFRPRITNECLCRDWYTLGLDLLLGYCFTMSSLWWCWEVVTGMGIRGGGGVGRVIIKAFYFASSVEYASIRLAIL